MIRFALILLALIFAGSAHAAYDPAHELARSFRNDVLTKQEQPERLAFFSSGVKATVNNPACPMGTGLGDGCPGHGGLYTVANCWSGVLQGTSTWPTSIGTNLWANSRPTWNTPACDYGVGATVSKATMLANPATYDPLYKDAGGNYVNLPADCRNVDAGAVGKNGITTPYWLHALNTANAMHIINCVQSASTITFQNLYMGSWPQYTSPATQTTILARTAVGIYSWVNNYTAINFTNMIFDADASVLLNNQITVTGRNEGMMELVKTGSDVPNVTFTDVSVLGNFGNSCCNVGVSLSLFYIATQAQITFSYTVFADILPYAASFALTAGTSAGITPKGSIQWDHSYISDCFTRAAVGHGECFSASQGWTTRNEYYNIWRMVPGQTVAEAFCHCDSIGGASGTTFVANTTTNIDHNLYLTNAQGPAQNGQNVKFHVNNGTVSFDAGGAAPSNVGIGQTLGVTNLFFYQQAGSNANGPIYTTDCGANQGATVYCPATQKPYMTFDGTLVNNTLTITNLHKGTSTWYTNSLVTTWTDGGATSNITSNTRITGWVSGDDGGVGHYTVNNSQTVASEKMLLSYSNGQLLVLASITGTDLNITNFYNLVPVGGSLVGTGVLGGTQILSQTSGDPNGLAVYTVSVPADPSNPNQNPGAVTGMTVDSGVFGNVTDYNYVVTKNLDTRSMNYVFDYYYSPMDGTYTMTNNIFDSIGLYSNTNGIATPSTCLFPGSTPPGNYVKSWSNNFDLNSANGLNTPGGAVTTYEFSRFPSSGC